MTIDRRIKHFTADNIERLLERRSIFAMRTETHRGSTMIYANTALPTARYMLGVLGFSFSEKYGYWFRMWRAGE